MDGWVIGLIAVVGQTVITTLVGWIVKTWLDKKNQEREELEKLKERERASAEQQRCDLVKNTVHEEITSLEKRLNEQSTKRFEQTQSDIALLKDGLQKDLYVDLCNICDQYKKHIKGGGYITRGQKTEYDKIYWTYHNLGKNGVADGMHNEVMAMPEEPKGE